MNEYVYLLFHIIIRENLQKDTQASYAHFCIYVFPAMAIT